MLYTEREIFILGKLKKQGLNRNTVDFFLEMVEIFKATDVLESTSSRLAIKIGRTERSVQRYVKALREKGLLHVEPEWNNSNPDKPYIVKNTYTLTSRARDLITDAHINFPSPRMKGKDFDSIFSK